MDQGVEEPLILSDDQRWWWDGRRWRRVEEHPAGRVLGELAGPAAVPSAPVATRRRGTTLTSALVLVAVAGILAGGLWFVGHAPPRQPGQASGCAPRPCIRDGGLVLYIDQVAWSVPVVDPHQPPEAGNQLVRLTVHFVYEQGSGTRTVTPYDLELKDASGIARPIGPSGGPPPWGSTDLEPGSSLGPKDLVFQAPQEARSATLVWRPVANFGPHLETRVP